MLQTGHRLLRSAYGGRSTCCSQAVVSPCPQSHKPSIIFQHPELLAINKPPGRPFHSRDGVVGVIPTLRHMEAANEIPQLGPLYPLHRCPYIWHAVLQDVMFVTAAMLIFVSNDYRGNARDGHGVPRL